MVSDEEYKSILSELDKRFGGREGFVLHALVISAASGQPTYITTYSGKRFLEVTVDPSFIYPFMYGAGPKRIATVMEEIKVRDRQGRKSTVSFNDIWIILPIPKEGLSEEVLKAVNISDGDKVDPSTGESIREMVRKSYHCKDEAEVEYFLRRYLAS